MLISLPKKDKYCMLEAKKEDIVMNGDPVLIECSVMGVGLLLTLIGGILAAFLPWRFGRDVNRSGDPR